MTIAVAWDVKRQTKPKPNLQIHITFTQTVRSTHSGSVLNLRLSGHWFELNQRHCGMSLLKQETLSSAKYLFNPGKVPDMAEKLLFVMQIINSNKQIY